jgi:hypothetical protein
LNRPPAAVRGRRWTCVDGNVKVDKSQPSYADTARRYAALAALFATVAGALLALWLRYTGPDTTLSFEIMLDILLIVVIGGMGTLYGAVIGSVLFVLSVCSFPTWWWGGCARGLFGRFRASW